jgi:predicted permease
LFHEEFFIFLSLLSIYYPRERVLINFRLGLMIRWSYGYRYLLAPEDYESDIESEDSLEIRSHRRPTMESDENTPFIPSYDRRSPNEPSHSRRTSRSEFQSSEYEYSTAGTSPIDVTTPLLINRNDDDNIISFPPPRGHRSRSWYRKIQRFCIFAWREFLEFMNMPLWAMLVAIAIALYPQLQNYLFFQRSFIRGSVIYAIQTCGDVSIPLILVILGANIGNEDPPVLDSSQTDPVVDRKWSLTQRQRGIVLGVACRVIIVPVITPPLN